MKYLNTALALVVTVFGSAPSAMAGVTGAISTQVEALSDVVTYSAIGTAALNTKVGYKVTVRNVAGNTVNNVVFAGSAVVRKLSDGTVNPNELPYLVEVNDDAGACGTPTGNSTSVSCNLGQLRAGASRVFAVFFKGPVKNNDCFVAGGPSCEVVTFAGATNYSEGMNDTTGANDQSLWTGPADVPLGTANPTNVRSALPKSGGTFFTGLDAVPSLLTYPFAAKVTAPNPPVYSSAAILLSKVTANDEVQVCTAAGNFKNCYASQVTIPGVIYVDGSNYLTIVLRVDSSEINTPFRPANIKVYYEGSDSPLPLCSSLGGVPTTTDPHCALPATRYSNAASNGDLRGDVEVVVLGLTNGTYRIR